ncbi:hypothetical protein [Tahibacter harae]|uniref:Lipoprotein n=1 Tax=Tahibacter harae TaxID=2963937 RepID=A0ABT1QWA0_9GAMM|nr:hypothetical protein [Tahibacter harae]MCQ4166558.1 hypothetical protein [Tahibacter harae]
MTRVLVFCLALSALAGCSGADKAAPPPAPPAVLSDQQQQALQKAQALRDQHAEQRKAELDARMDQAENGQ